MGNLLDAQSPAAAASRMASSIAATLFLLTAVAVAMRPSGAATGSQGAIVPVPPSAGLNYAAVR